MRLVRVWCRYCYSRLIQIFGDVDVDADTLAERIVCESDRRDHGRLDVEAFRLLGARPRA